MTAFTATATSRVQEDIINKLGLVRPHTVRARFDRANLFYYVTAKENRDAQILNFVQKASRRIRHHLLRYPQRSRSRHRHALCAQGINALPYHAGLDGSIRERNQEAFNRDDVPDHCGHHCLRHGH